MHSESEERKPSPLLLVRVIIGDGARTGEGAGSAIGDGDLDDLEVLGFDFVRKEREDSLSAGNGGVILSSMVDGLYSSPGLTR